MSVRLPADFDAEFYLSTNPDVAEAGMDAADHYLRYGWNEGRAYKKTQMEQLLSTAEDRARFGLEVQKCVLDLVFGSNHDSMDLDKIAVLAASIDSAQYAINNMVDARRFDNPYSLLDFAIDRSSSYGLNLEFGVFSGGTINHMARAAPGRKFYGFDSFEGLPEAWRPGLDKGLFARADLPLVENNIELVKGWFDRTLPSFLDIYTDDLVSIIHMDCDLYSSTRTVLSLLRDRIIPGTIIVFDEYFNYPGWRRHEWLAFHEFVNYYRRSYEYIGLVPGWQQVAVRIVK